MAVRSILALFLVMFAVAPVAVRQTQIPPAKPMSQDEMEVRVRTDAARRLRVAVEDVRVAETAERTWPDRGLGCNARRGVFEPAPTPGYSIVVEAGTRRLTYHTDRSGRLLRCILPAKPLDPIK